MVQFECPRHPNPSLSSVSDEFPFPIISLPLSGVIRIGLSSIKIKKFENLGNKIGLNCYNEKGRKVEADVAMCPLLSLFRREEHGDGDTYVPYALQNY